MLIENRLSCEIPAEPGNLSGLTELWLRNNDLSGRIPPELARLSNLTQIHLSRNSLTGCIPSALRSVGASDLDSLGLFILRTSDGSTEPGGDRRPRQRIPHVGRARGLDGDRLPATAPPPRPRREGPAGTRGGHRQR